MEPAGLGAASGGMLWLTLKPENQKHAALINCVIPFETASPRAAPIHCQNAGYPNRNVCAARDLIAHLNPYPSNGFSVPRNIPYNPPDDELTEMAIISKLTLADRYMSIYGTNRYLPVCRKQGASPEEP